jgi:hypothetical protein
MKIFIRLFIFVFIFSFINCGCISSKITLNTAKPFEKRYTSKDSIKINDEKIIIEEKESIWILTDSTLNNLLQYASGNNIQEIE